MVKEPGHTNELLPALALCIWAMVRLLPVNRGVDVSVQCVGRLEPLVAYVAFPERAVESTLGSRVVDVLFLVPLNLPVGDRTMWITLADHGQDGVAVELWRIDARARLGMVGNTARGGIVVSAEGAGNVFPAMSIRVKVL